MRRYFKTNLYISLALASLVGGVLLYIGLEHNAQQEFYSVEEGQVQFGYMAVIFLSWAIPVFVFCMLIGSMVYLIYRSINRLPR